jgi:hypothetical protein
MGNIYSALRELQALKAGTSNVTGVYVGTDLIWPLITPTPTITPTSTFTPTPTSTPTVTPTNTITPTVTSTNTPTPTITPYPVCPQQLEITQTNEPRIDVGTYTRATIASGTTFDYGYFDQTQFVIGRAPDGNYYPIYQYISGDTNTLYRGFSGSTDLGWYGREEFFNPLLNPPPYIGGQRTFGSDYITVGDARFFKSGSNTGSNPGSEPEDVTIYIQYSIVCPTPTPTVTPTNTATPTVTPTVTRTVTPTITPTVTPTNTQTPTVTPTNTVTVTPTNTQTPTTTSTNTPTPTPSPVVASITYVSYSGINTSQTTYTFNGISIGGPGLIGVAIHNESTTAARTISSVSINGNAATIASQIAAGPGSLAYTTTGVAYLRITGGTTANISITFSGAVSRSAIGIWRIQNNISDTPIQTQTNSANNGTGLTINFTSLTTNNVAVCANTVGIETSSVSWTNATVRYNQAIAAGANTRVSGADFTTTSSGNRTVITSNANSGQPLTLVGVVWN